MKSIHVDATGKGFALLDLAYRFNINAPDAKPAFSLKSKAQLVDDHIKLAITLSYLSPKACPLKHKRSNMCILQADLPSGFVVQTEHLTKLKAKESTIKLTETKDGDTAAIVYFDYLTSEAITLEIVALREFIVDDRKPTPIVVYDYYDSGKKRV